MTLQTEFTDRYPNQKVIELTNNDDVGATTVNTTTLDAAAADVQADFRLYSGVLFDLTDNRHVVTGVKGMEFYLTDRIGVFGGAIRDQIFDIWKSRLEDLGNVTSRERISPTTNSRLDVTGDSADGLDKPAFDTLRFGDYIPTAPRSGRRFNRTEPHIDR